MIRLFLFWDHSPRLSPPSKASSLRCNIQHPVFTSIKSQSISGKLKNSVPSLRSRSVCQPWKEHVASRKATIQTRSTQVFISVFSFFINSFHSTEPIERIPDPHIINKSRLLNKRLTINVGGVRHEVSLLHIGCLPHYISHFKFPITFHIPHSTLHFTGVVAASLSCAPLQAGPSLQSSNPPGDHLSLQRLLNRRE